MRLHHPLQVIIYVDDANDEVPLFTQQQYNRLGLRETAGIGTSVIVVRATDPDTGESSCQMLVRVSSCLLHKGTFVCLYLLCCCWYEAIACRSPTLTLVNANAMSNIVYAILFF